MGSATGDGLADSLVRCRADRGCEVQRSLAANHGEGDQSIGKLLQNRIRQAAGFFAEQQVVAAAEVGIPRGPSCLGREDPDSSLRMGEQIRLPAFMLGGLQPRPVIQPGAPARLLGSIEPEWFDEVQRAAARDACAADIARVVRDLRLVQNDVKKRTAQPFFSASRRAFTPGSTSSSVLIDVLKPASIGWPCQRMTPSEDMTTTCGMPCTPIALLSRPF